jgi:CspA family cold shock protein
VDRALNFWTRQRATGRLPLPKITENPDGGVPSGDWLQDHAVWKRDLMNRITGTVKFFNFSKGYGFVQPDDGSKDVFLHASALERAGIQGLNEGDKITFVLEDDRKGRGKQAAQVELA